MRIATPHSHAGRPRRGTQRGVYAVEYALVFLLLFALLYGIVSYGILMTLRFGLQNAAEDGARAALHYQQGTNAVALPLRQAEAARVAAARIAGWPAITPQVVARICRAGTSACTPADCGTAWEQRCVVQVTVTATGLRQMLPLLVFVLPETLAAEASMRLDATLT